MSGRFRFRAVINLKEKRHTLILKPPIFCFTVLALCFSTYQSFGDRILPHLSAISPSRGSVNETLDHNEIAAVISSEMQEVFFYCGFALIQFQRFSRRLVKLTHSKCESKAWSELISCA